MNLEEKAEIKRALNSESNTDCYNPILLTITTCKEILEQFSLAGKD